MGGRKIARLLHNRVCRELIEGGYRSVHEAVSQDPDVPTAKPSRAQVRSALNKLELADVVETFQGGYWQLERADDFLAVLEQIDKLPAKVETLENLAHPVGWSVIACLAQRQRTRAGLHLCGASARITEQVKSLVKAKAAIEQADQIILLDPLDHRAVQDALDMLAHELAFRASLVGRVHVAHPRLRYSVGTRYCSDQIRDELAAQEHESHTTLVPGQRPAR